jgi:capsular polysaccharide biosynthesis protein
MKILIYNSGGGLGDSIQLFDLITTLKKNLVLVVFITYLLTKITLMER